MFQKILFQELPTGLYSRNDDGKLIMTIKRIWLGLVHELKHMVDFTLHRDFTRFHQGFFCPAKVGFLVLGAYDFFEAPI